MTNLNATAAKAALEFYIDHGVDISIGDEAVDRTLSQPAETPQTAPSPSHPAAASPTPLIGKQEATQEAIKRAQAAQTLEGLKQAISEFGGIAIKKTATNLVFADGNPAADIMLIGDAPISDDDRAGLPFMGQSGQLLNKILGSIGLTRDEEDAQKSAYLSNILNWRPPGNRTPNPAEIEVSLPFIERHIQLAQPKLIILSGGIAAKALLGSGDSLSKLRKKWHDYIPQTPELSSGASPIPAIVTYHPTYLLQTPAQKRAVWHDMLEVKKKLSS
ncbi:MAG: uracil-DNA glycosylase [Alphaproteobacteria bacterium]